MKKSLALFLISILTLFPLACANQQNTARGAALGTVAGTAAGAAISRARGGSGWTGALLGGVAGLAAGSVIGNTMDQNAAQVQKTSSQASDDQPWAKDAGYQKTTVAQSQSVKTSFKPGKYYICGNLDPVTCKKELKAQAVWDFNGAITFNHHNHTGAIDGPGNHGEMDYFSWEEQGNTVIITYKKRGPYPPEHKPGTKAVIQIVSRDIIKDDLGKYYLWQSSDICTNFDDDLCWGIGTAF